MSTCASCAGVNPSPAASCPHCGPRLGSLEPATAGEPVFSRGPAPAGEPAAATGRRRARLAALFAVVLCALALLALAGAAIVFVVPDREAPPPARAPLSWTTIGTSVEGRPIEVASFGSGTRRRVLVIGGVHGGEHGALAAGQLAGYLYAHPRALPAGAGIDIIRCLNPDGDAAGTRGNAHNVDLNRNLPTANWRARLSRNDESRSKLHCTGGTSPGSEPEVQALLGQIDTGYDAVLSLHSYGGILDANGPGGRRLAQRMRAVCGLKLDTVPYDASITGSMGQYIPAKYGILIVTVELDSPSLSPRMIEALLVPAR